MIYCRDIHMQTRVENKRGVALFFAGASSSSRAHGYVHNPRLRTWDVFVPLAVEALLNRKAVERW